MDDINELIENSLSADSLNIRDVIRSLGIKNTEVKTEKKT
jgi:hypothetical protein